MPASTRSSAVRSLSALRGVRRGVDLPSAPPPRAAEIPRGRLLELAGGPRAARSSGALRLLLEAQAEGDPVVWIQPAGGPLYPPDLAAGGLDLRALVVVHVPAAEGPGGLPRAAELALRTGAFGAVVLDLADARPPRGEAWLGRLSSLAREHDARCVLLGPDRAASFGPLVPLRLRVQRRDEGGAFQLETQVLKDKAGIRPALRAPALRGPEGLTSVPPPRDRSPALPSAPSPARLRRALHGAAGVSP